MFHLKNVPYYSLWTAAPSVFWLRLLEDPGSLLLGWIFCSRESQCLREPTARQEEFAVRPYSVEGGNGFSVIAADLSLEPGQGSFHFRCGKLVALEDLAKNGSMSVKQALSEALGSVQGTNQPRGLHNFIQEIRLCSNATQEQVSRGVAFTKSLKLCIIHS